MKRYGFLFFLPSMVFLVAGLTGCLLFPREEVHLALNRWHGPFTDTLFRAWTLLGEGWFMVVLAVLLAFHRIRTGLTVLVCYLIPGLAAQVLKNLVFPHTPRPVKFFELHGSEISLPLVTGTELHMWKSFPSGHAAAAFGVFFGLSLILKSRILQFVLFLGALGVAYSRIYLSQHFLIDTLGGAVLGLSGGYLGWWWMEKSDRDWMDVSLMAKWKARK